MTKIATPNETIIDLSSEPENELNRFVGVTDGFAWYELDRMRIQAEQMAGKLHNLKDALKQQEDAQYAYFVDSMQIQAEQMTVKLKNLQDTLKQQADAQYAYFAHLRKKLEDAEDGKDNRNQGS